jgi:hypothetical protein
MAPHSIHTPFPGAGHCPGAVMFLLEHLVALHTGGLPRLAGCAGGGER